MESRLEDAWGNDSYDSTEASWDSEGAYDSYDSTEAIFPPRRPPPPPPRPPVRTGPAVLNTPAGRAQMQVPGLAALTERVNAHDGKIDTNTAGIAQLKQDRAD